MEIYKENHIRHKKINKGTRWGQKNPRKGFTLKPRRKHVDNIKTDLKETICKTVYWIELFQDIEIHGIW